MMSYDMIGFRQKLNGGQLIYPPIQRMLISINDCWRMRVCSHARYRFKANPTRITTACSPVFAMFYCVVPATKVRDWDFFFVLHAFDFFVFLRLACAFLAIPRVISAAKGDGQLCVTRIVVVSRIGCFVQLSLWRWHR